MAYNPHMVPNGNQDKASFLDKVAGHEGPVDWEQNQINALVYDVKQGGGVIKDDLDAGLQDYQHHNAFDSPLMGSHSFDPMAGGHYETNLTGLKEGQLVHAWRSPWVPEWTPEKRELGVVHKLQRHDYLVTIQFLSDQHRVQMNTAAVMPLDNTPSTFPATWLRAGQNLPTATECQAIARHEDQQRELMERMGQPVPPRFHSKDLKLPHKRVERAERWGMPATTLVALRNRSIPMSEMSGCYTDHFYTNLYENDFYPRKPQHVLDRERGDLPGDTNFTRHIYVPLHGPPREQLEDSSWRHLPAEEILPGYY